MSAERFFGRIASEPWRFDFFQALRRLETLHPNRPRFGRAARPLEEPVRLGQEPTLAFPPATFAALEPGREGRPPRLLVRFFGLLGPNGPLPLHLTEFARARIIHDHDPTIPRFLDLFHHRFLLMFYRAWAQAQPAVSLDRPADDRFAAYVGALFGFGTPELLGRDPLGDSAKLHVAGLLGRQVRNRDGIVQILTGYFRVPVRLEEFAGHWMPLPETERTRLGRNWAALGRDAVVGTAVWDRQHRVRLHLGPLDLARYESFLPGGRAFARLVGWMRFYLGLDLAWDLRLSLARSEVPPARLGAGSRLGWTTWVGTRRGRGDADDLTLDPERFAGAAAPA